MDEFVDTNHRIIIVVIFIFFAHDSLGGIEIKLGAPTHAVDLTRRPPHVQQQTVRRQIQGAGGIADIVKGELGTGRGAVGGALGVDSFALTRIEVVDEKLAAISAKSFRRNTKSIYNIYTQLETSHRDAAGDVGAVTVFVVGVVDVGYVLDDFACQVVGSKLIINEVCVCVRVCHCGIVVS